MRDWAFFRPCAQASVAFTLRRAEESAVCHSNGRLQQLLDGHFLVIDVPGDFRSVKVPDAVRRIA
jgi:hypothetical protein